MAETPFTKKHVDIITCKMFSPLTSSDATVERQRKNVLSEILPITSRIVIYENLMSPTLSGEIFLDDSVNYSSVFPLIGVEAFQLAFKISTPDAAGVRTYGVSSPLIFHVYNQTNRNPFRMGLEKSQLGMVSGEAIDSLNVRASKVYKDLPVHTVVEKIVEEFIKTEKNYGQKISPSDNAPYFETTTTDQTKPYRLVLPYISPLQAIKLACLQAQTTDNTTNFFFYETLDGFYFRSLRQLIEKGKQRWRANPVYVRRVLAGISNTKDTENYISAEEIQVISNYDYLYALTNGYFASTTIGVDVLSGAYRLTPSSIYDEPFKSRIRLNNTPLYWNELGKNSNPSSRLYVVPTTAISAADSKIRSKDPSVTTNFFEQTLATRNRELTELQMITVRVKCAGGPDIRVGNVVHIDIPSPLNSKISDSAPTFYKEDLRTGLYLITAVKHELINNGKSFIYETTFEASSDSVK